MALLTALDVGDPAGAWEALGFSVVGGTVWVDNVAHRLDMAGSGLLGWELWGVSPAAPGSLVAPGSLDGVPTRVVDDPPAPVESRHPNGVIGLDHVVVTTPDHGRTVSLLEQAGMECRRIRDLGGSRAQAFFRLGPVILEVVGSTAPDGATGAAQLFGLAWTCADLDATASMLGDRLRGAKDAVQPGRRIATLDAEAGVSVAMAFMSPELGRGGT